MIIYICLMAVMAYLAFRWGKETKTGTCHMMKEYTEKKEMAEQVGNLLQFVGKCACASGGLMAVCFFWRMLAGDFPRVLAAVSILFYSVGFIRAMLILQKYRKKRGKEIEVFWYHAVRIWSGYSDENLGKKKTASGWKNRNHQR